jgi:hypothetical protein
VAHPPAGGDTVRTDEPRDSQPGNPPPEIRGGTPVPGAGRAPRRAGWSQEAIPSVGVARRPKRGSSGLSGNERCAQ